ncbi:creatininase [Zhengella mangrovi]|uniref:Creatininase n=1 Tax=Zhengella mangrovi TaxID=1982044 RepID=A0A2G1QMG1_9HYPH|nr:creatininase [Zhengella mangrovi]
MLLPRRHYNQMTAGELSGAKAGGWIAVLPLGATEQHGPHLPFETDTIIAEGVAERLVKRAPAGLPLTILPAEPVGYSVEHLDVAGSRTLAFDEAVNRWIGIGERLFAQGFRKLLMLNAHGGNSPLMTVVATELRVRLSMLAVATSWTRFIVPGQGVSAEEKAFGIHGGQVETAVMLALRPDLVDMAQAADFPSAQADHAGTFTHLRAYGPHAYGWMMSDLNPQGVAGNASAATADLGETLLDTAADGLVALVRDIHAFNPPWLAG